MTVLTPMNEDSCLGGTTPAVLMPTLNVIRVLMLKKGENRRKRKPTITGEDSEKGRIISYPYPICLVTFF